MTSEMWHDAAETIQRASVVASASQISLPDIFLSPEIMEYRHATSTPVQQTNNSSNGTSIYRGNAATGFVDPLNTRTTRAVPSSNDKTSRLSPANDKRKTQGSSRGSSPISPDISDINTPNNSRNKVKDKKEAITAKENSMIKHERTASGDSDITRKIKKFESLSMHKFNEGSIPSLPKEAKPHAKAEPSKKAKPDAKQKSDSKRQQSPSTNPPPSSAGASGNSKAAPSFMNAFSLPWSITGSKPTSIIPPSREPSPRSHAAPAQQLRSQVPRPQPQPPAAPLPLALRPREPPLRSVPTPLQSLPQIPRPSPIPDFPLFPPLPPLPKIPSASVTGSLSQLNHHVRSSSLISAHSSMATALRLSSGAILTVHPAPPLNPWGVTPYKHGRISIARDPFAALRQDSIGTTVAIWEGDKEEGFNDEVAPFGGPHSSHEHAVMEGVVDFLEELLGARSPRKWAAWDGERE